MTTPYVPLPHCRHLESLNGNCVICHAKTYRGYEFSGDSDPEPRPSGGLMDAYGLRNGIDCPATL